ncbi:MAG: hypothetical protein KF841_09190 [Phycisphaerae bacterium]|nr:hypothetical protein [Phycisphaerae bacterium]
MALNRESLERLVIDNELGELNQDASALLDAYLVADADAFTLASEISRTLAETRIVMTDQTASHEQGLPPPKFLGRVHPAADHDDSPQVPRLTGSDHSCGPSVHQPRQWIGFAAAAAIAMAASFGYWPTVRDLTGTGSSRTHLVRSTNLDVGGNVFVAPESKKGFWHIRELPRTPSASGGKSSLKVRWTGPLDPPQIGESL